MMIIPDSMLPKRNPDEIPGETVTDKITMSDGAEIDNTPAAIHQYNLMRKQTAEDARRQYNQRQQANETGRLCPLSHDAWVQPVSCSKACALFVGDSCALAARPGKVDTNGRPCPLKRRCTPSCALYNGAGCTLTNAATAEKG